MEIDWSVIFATLAGPILAVWASEWRQQRRARHDRKEWVFRTLMTTRSTPLRQEHVAALNHIDFAFPQSEYPQISDAWGLYYAHLNTSRGDTADSLARWDESANGFLSEIIHLMASDLKIPFSKTQIKKPAYYPSGYVFTEGQQNELRALALQVLKGERAIPVHVPNEKP
jgi:hypothetical protein